jgi:aspartate aminotransferase-like enzyme
MQNRITNLNIATVNNEDYIRESSSEQLIYFRTQQLADKAKYCENSILKHAGCLDGKVLLLTGTGTLAMEAIVDNMVSKNDKVFIINGGTFGKRWVDICKRQNKTYNEYISEFGKDLNIEVIENLLKEYSPTFLLMQHVETSSGQLNDVKTIGSLCKKYNIKLIVDGMGSFLIHETNMDECNIYGLATSSHKGLSVYPGIGIVILNKEAKSATFNSMSVYTDFNKYLNDFVELYFPYTTNSLVVNQMYLKLKDIDKNGIHTLLNKIKNLAYYFRKEISHLPLKIAAESPSNCCTVLYTEKTDVKYFFNKMVQKNIYFTPTGGLAGKIFSVGHIGDLSENDYDDFIWELERWLI